MELYVTLHTIAELVGISHETARRWVIPHKEYQRKQLGPFPPAHGRVLAPGRKGRPSSVYPLSQVLDWIAENRPYDLRIALQLGEVGRSLGRLDEREAERQSSKASRASTIT